MASHCMGQSWDVLSQDYFLGASRRLSMLGWSRAFYRCFLTTVIAEPTQKMTLLRTKGCLGRALETSLLSSQNFDFSTIFGPF
ncbi:hypothetical protein TNIN_57471 [Trichonephila inaurata madagascariensis]|uniref:Uncharacterized protein n=1 Tax=Trichonephila inaurata madagascariensis TaxID=2747483 RepID=A0A8X6XSG4_9ARAC|nr:hypothetical protein TNIN_57471 [Trichonephila inaurata madagascariensis]